MSTASVKSLAEKRVRRQKQFIAVGSVVLLAVLGFELPKVLGGHSAQTAPVVTTSSTSVGSLPPVAPGKLPDTDRVVVQRDSNQLLSFGLFKSKDPFVQQLSTSAAPTVPASTTTTPHLPPGGLGAGQPPVTTTTRAQTTPASTVPNPSPTPPAAPPTTTAAGGTTPTPTPTPTSTSTTPTPPPARPTSVLISTNGVCETVALKGTFPANENIFRVVSIAGDGKAVEIGVVGGSYDSGQAAATLKLGETLTLVNTADGTRYVIALKSKCDAVTQPAPVRSTTTTPTTTTATTPVPPAPTTTSATAPIVTDSVDTTVPSS